MKTHAILLFSATLALCGCATDAARAPVDIRHLGGRQRGGLC